jgi:hypothetical protein
MAFKPRETTKPQKRLWAYVATPAYDGKVQTDFAMSVAESCQVAALMGINVTVCMMRNGAFIDLSRNNFVRLFLETECTHLFFIDSDLKWEPRAFVGLLTSGKPICAGAYPKRQEPEEYPVRYKPHPEQGGLWVDNGWIMCDRVPTGFLCIERSVLERMVAKAPVIKSSKDPTNPRLFYTYMNEDDMFVGEDFAFCKDYVAEFNEYIPVWPDFDFTHGERFTGNFHTFLNEQVKKEEAISTSAAA